jgi:hypothetical protein
MSEIPLRTIRRNKSRAGYSQLANSEVTPSTSTSSDMPSHNRVIAAASRTTLRKHISGKPRKNDHYGDDIEEEARLLGEDTYEEDGFDEGGGTQVPVMSKPVRFEAWANV